MAKIWLCRYGVPASSGKVLADRPLAECVSKLKVGKGNFVGSLTAKVQFGNPDDALSQTKSFQTLIFVSVHEPEAGANGWKAGYYLAPLPTAEAVTRMGLKLPPE